MKHLIMMIATVMVVFISACSETQEAVTPDRDLPIATLEDNHEIRNSDATYYKSWNFFKEGEPSSECSALLRELVDKGIQIKNTWFPASPTPCAAMGAVTIVVVELTGPDEDMRDFGFAPDPEDWWIINCGVPSLWHYSFEQPAKGALETTWVAMEPVQCLGNPWEQDWLENHDGDYDSYPKDPARPGLEPEEFEVIQDYYNGGGVGVFEGRTASKYDSVCLACSCPEGHTLFLQVRDQDVEAMVGWGYRVEPPGR